MNIHQLICHHQAHIHYLLQQPEPITFSIESEVQLMFKVHELFCSHRRVEINVSLVSISNVNVRYHCYPCDYNLCVGCVERLVKEKSQQVQLVTCLQVI